MGNDAMIQAFQMIGKLPQLFSKLEMQQHQIAVLTKEVRSLETIIQAKTDEVNGWMDTPQAQKYLSVSRNTFDKYRYSKKSRIKLVGHRVDGKTLFNKEELDRFVKIKQLERK